MDKVTSGAAAAAASGNLYAQAQAAGQVGPGRRSTISPSGSRRSKASRARTALRRRPPTSDPEPSTGGAVGRGSQPTPDIRWIGRCRWQRRAPQVKTYRGAQRSGWLAWSLRCPGRGAPSASCDTSSNQASSSTRRARRTGGAHREVESTDRAFLRDRPRYVGLQLRRAKQRRCDCAASPAVSSQRRGEEDYETTQPESDRCWPLPSQRRGERPVNTARAGE